MVKKYTKIIDSFINMRISGGKFRCPYWSNKLRKGIVILRGFENGKGEAEIIRNKLESLIEKSENKNRILSDPIVFQKFAKRNRIGIDCSGFVYRILESITDIASIFKGGINRTNAASLTDEKSCLKIELPEGIRPLDLIRLNRGNHVVLVTDISGENINYIHSSNLTEMQGVHRGRIKLSRKIRGLENQAWAEKTKNGENFGKKFFLPQSGDGIYRLKILARYYGKTS